MELAHGTGSTAPVYESTELSLNRGRPSTHLGPRFHMVKRYVLLLIVTVDFMMDDTRSLADLAAAARTAIVVALTHGSGSTVMVENGATMLHSRHNQGGTDE
jgi:hypothetical protein